MNAFDQMREAMNEAEAQMRAADSASDRMARMLCGRLRKVPGHILVELKRELQQFDACRKIWKEER